MHFRRLAVLLGAGLIASLLGVIAPHAAAAAASPQLPSNLVVSSFGGPGTSYVDDVDASDTTDSCQYGAAGSPAIFSIFSVAAAPDGAVYALDAYGHLYSIGTDAPGTAWVSSPTFIASTGPVNAANGVVMLNDTYAYAVGSDLQRIDVTTGAVVDLGTLPSADVGDVTFKDGSVFYLTTTNGSNSVLEELPVSDLDNNAAAAGSIPPSDWTTWGVIRGTASHASGIATDANGDTWLLDSEGFIYRFVIPTSAQPSLAVGTAIRNLGAAGCIPNDYWDGLASEGSGSNVFLPDVGVSLAGPTSTAAGAQVTETVTVSNTGAGPADDIQVLDPAPDAQVTAVSASSADCATLPCIIPALPPGASEAITVTMAVSAHYTDTSPFTTQAAATCAAGDLGCNVGGTVKSAVLATDVVVPTSVPVPDTGAAGWVLPWAPAAVVLTLLGCGMLVESRRLTGRGR